MLTQRRSYRRKLVVAAALGCGDAAAYEKQAREVAAGLDQLYDADTGLWLAADDANALPDVWGSAYLVALNASTAARRARAVGYLVAQQASVFRWGQVRHLPTPLTWQKCFGPCPGNGTYQNGAYWATPLHYVVQAALLTGHRAFATSLLNATMDYFVGRFKLKQNKDLTSSSRAITSRGRLLGAAVFLGSVH